MDYSDLSADEKDGLLSDSSDIRNCQFEFKCPKRWRDLAILEDESQDIRFCNQCEQKVFLCHTDKDLAMAIRFNRCVAIQFAYDDGVLPDGELLGVPAGPGYRTY